MPDEVNTPAADAQEPSARELATLFPAAKTRTIAGRAIEIPPCTLRRGGEIIDLGYPLWLKLRPGVDELTLIEEHPDEATAVLVAATGVEREWIAALEPIDKADLMIAWLEVNGDFFVRRLLSTRVRMHLAIAGMIGGGPASSPTSSAAAT